MVVGQWLLILVLVGFSQELPGCNDERPLARDLFLCWGKGAVATGGVRSPLGHPSGYDPRTDV